MKKILLLFLLIGFYGLAQKTKADVFIEKHVTSTQRDALTVPSGETWHIYNSTTGQNEVNVAGGGWVAEGADGLGTARDVGPFTVVDADNATIDAGAITSTHILNSTIQSVDILDGTIVENDIQAGAVGTTAIGSGAIVEDDLFITNTPTDNWLLSSNTAGANFTWVDPASVGGGANLASADQSIPGSTTRVVDTDASGSVLSFENVGTEIMTVGDNNDNAVQVLGLESLSGNTIALVSPVKFPSFDTGSTPASGYDRALVEDSGDGEPYYSDGTNWNQLLFLEADIITEAEIADGAIQEEHLKAVNSPTDEYVLTYESTTGDFEWQAAAAASLPVVDTSELIEGSADATKLLRFENDTHIPTSTTVVVTAPSADLDLEEVLISDPSAVTGADAVTNIMSLTQSEYDAITPDASTVYIITDAKQTYQWIVPITAQGDDIASATSVTSMWTSQAVTITAVYAYLSVAPTGSVATFDINEDGSTILSTKITVDATEKTSSTAATPPVISDSAIDAHSEITFDVDGVGSTTAGTTGTIVIQYTID